MKLRKYYSSPKVFVLETEKEFKKNNVVEYTTKYDKIIELIIYKLVKSVNGINYYSYIRADGKNRKTILEAKIEKRKDWADSNEKKSDEYYQASKEGSNVIPFGQPIIVGHHSEKKHRALISRNHKRMDNCVKYSQKAEDHILKAKNLEHKLKRELPIDTPDCLKELREQLNDAKEVHKLYKENKESREHAFSLTYANKKVKDLTKRLEIATDLWA
jgi:hypothetical protein